MIIILKTSKKTIFKRHYYLFNISKTIFKQCKKNKLSKKNLMRKKCCGKLTVRWKTSSRPSSSSRRTTRGCRTCGKPPTTRKGTRPRERTLGRWESTEFEKNIPCLQLSGTEKRPATLSRFENWLKKIIDKNIVS